MNAGHRNTVRRRQKGVGLIEVLVAVIVLAVGLLGVAVLQARTLRNNQSSYQRSMAVVQVHAIADAMRADRNAAISGDFDIALADDEAVAPATFPELAIRDWRTDLVGMLGPDANGSIDCDGSLCTITIVWNDERGTDGDEAFTLETQFQL